MFIGGIDDLCQHKLCELEYKYNDDDDSDDDSDPSQHRLSTGCFFLLAPP